ncbi:N-(5'-phosphoribosyl)anthranilate isomerase [Winogradskyella sp. J14-2]|uniref:phosphoribosylanthranilate isomerase n=1 Tax=Winogradskyella sp. J14-2 TaxID=1936080 RepID=UPI0009728C6B|nr:phosphoribosylanthranilate isomerase [Winogradskyella sp. J14-2]APY09601.1 N-(5'-phosphoribosyl)anthranilate isomerase [Winogradskyella sp. J14-2]
MKIKICGMKYNTAEVAKLQPNYLGFIFYKKSSRNFEGDIPELPKTIKKVGVFVDEAIEVIMQKIEKYDLDAIQLHGNESPDYCKVLKRHYEKRSDEVISSKETNCHALTKSIRTRNDKLIEIIKVFSIKDKFDFSQLQPYEDYVDYFLFDTKGKLPGGNGYTFNWDVLKDYPSTKPYFLSGGIGLEEMDNVLSFMQREESKYCHAIDINSKFEIKPGLKAIEKLEEFITNLSFRT